jgi:hypothetical protein
MKFKYGIKQNKGLPLGRAYESWRGIKYRCKHPIEKRGNTCYKGITVCERWENSFENFIADMGLPKTGESIDRIDSTKGYSPENCRWADVTTQSRNRGYVKLSLEKAAEIRSLYAQGNISQQKLADIYNVSQLHISNVIRYKAWAA